jgi:hypothetical protein
MKTIIIAIVLVATAGAMGDVTVNVTSYASISNITTWPVAYTDASVANPSTYNVGENNYGGAPLYSLAQSWTATVSGPLTDIQIAISGTAPVNFNLNLYDGGTSGWADIIEGTYNPGVNVSNNLFSSSLAVMWTGYNNSGDTAAVLDFAFSSADGVAVTSGHQYIFEIASEDNPNGMFWYRCGPGSNYTAKAVIMIIVILAAVTVSEPGIGQGSQVLHIYNTIRDKVAIGVEAGKQSGLGKNIQISNVNFSV